MATTTRQRRKAKPADVGSTTTTPAGIPVAAPRPTADTGRAPIPRRDYEEALRSLGALLDERRLEDVLLVEVESGFLVTGLRRRTLHADDPGTSRRYERAELTFRDRDVIAASVRGRARRGSGHHAGRYEEALRLIGRWVNRSGGSFVLLLDEGHGFLVRTFSSAAADLPHRIRTFRSSDLDQMRDEALEGRVSGGASLAVGVEAPGIELTDIAALTA